MKKTMAILLALAMLLTCAALADEEDDDQVLMQIVSCPEQGFSTLCRPEYTCTYHPDGGMTIWLGEPEVSSSVTMFMADASGADFDADYYFTNVYKALLESSYGDDLVDAGMYGTYNLSQREMPGQLSLFMSNGELRARFCAYDLREDCFVRYEGFCAGDNEALKVMLTAVAVAVGNFQPDPDYYKSEK